MRKTAIALTTLGALALSISPGSALDLGGGSKDRSESSRGGLAGAVDRAASGLRDTARSASGLVGSAGRGAGNLISEVGEAIRPSAPTDAPMPPPQPGLPLTQPLPLPDTPPTGLPLPQIRPEPPVGLAGLADTQALAVEPAPAAPVDARPNLAALGRPPAQLVFDPAISALPAMTFATDEPLPGADDGAGSAPAVRGSGGDASDGAVRDSGPPTDDPAVWTASTDGREVRIIGTEAERTAASFELAKPLPLPGSRDAKAEEPAASAGLPWSWLGLALVGAAAFGTRRGRELAGGQIRQLGRLLLPGRLAGSA